MALRAATSQTRMVPARSIEASASLVGSNATPVTGLPGLPSTSMSCPVAASQTWIVPSTPPHASRVPSLLYASPVIGPRSSDELQAIFSAVLSQARRDLPPLIHASQRPLQSAATAVIGIVWLGTATIVFAVAASHIFTHRSTLPTTTSRPSGSCEKPID